MNAERRILCVEDDADSCEIITELIQRSGKPFKVTAARTTDEALELIASERFDLYIVDTWVPEMGGLRLTRRIRENDAVTPILFYTAISSKPDKNKASDAGANAFLTKPNDLDSLVSTVTRLLEDCETIAA
jgi:CheY-like chemotaxis protein